METAVEIQSPTSEFQPKEEPRMFQKYSPRLTVIPEVSIPTTLCANGKTAYQYEQRIQQWIDKQAKSKEDESSLEETCLEAHPITELVSRLTNQIYLDNEEHLYILVTDVMAYINNSKPEIWIDNSGLIGKTKAFQEFEKSSLQFNCLFHIGVDIFILFLFSPMDVTFLLDLPGPSYEAKGKVQKMTNVFFHGNSSVYVSPNGGDGKGENGKTITIKFFEL